MEKNREGPSNLAILVAVISGGLSAAALIWAKEALGWSLWTFLFVFVVVAFVLVVIGGWITEAMRRHQSQPREGP